MKSIDLVREFHERFGQEIYDAPRIGNDGVNELRLKLLREETNELAQALAEHDVVGVLDALTDLQYVLDGAYLSLGFHRLKDAALAEVHRSNLSKLGEDGMPVLRADGKILKGPHYSPPNLGVVLADHRDHLVLDDRCTACGTDAFEGIVTPVRGAPFDEPPVDPVPTREQCMTFDEVTPLPPPPETIADASGRRRRDVEETRAALDAFDLSDEVTRG